MKRSAIKRSPMKPRTTRLRSTSPMKRRRPKHEAETMGSPARRTFVASLPCAACGREPTEAYPSQNAHVLPKKESHGGTGRKGHHTAIAPLCGNRGASLGCHRLFDDYRDVFDRRFPHFAPAVAAAATEAAWVLHQHNRKHGGGEA
jgi:hypothetical protein